VSSFPQNVAIIDSGFRLALPRTVIRGWPE
jgi:hypothetical protein